MIKKMTKRGMDLWQIFKNHKDKQVRSLNSMSSSNSKKKPSQMSIKLNMKSPVKKMTLK